MNKVAVIVDSSCGIKNGQYEHVFVIPLLINVNGAFLKEGEEISTSEVSQKLLDGMKLKTSQSSIGENIELVEKVFEKYEQVFVMPIPSKISSNIKTWEIIQKNYSDRLFVFDQTMVALPFEWTIKDIYPSLKAQTLTKEMLEKYLNEKREKSAIALIVPDLNFLISGGRIGAFKGGLAKLFKVKAVISLDYDGLNFYQKVIKSESLPNEVEKMLKDKIKFDPKKVKYATILRSKVQNTEFDINKIEDLLINKFKFKSITKGEVPATIQVHIGPNFIALGIQLV